MRKISIAQIEHGTRSTYSSFMHTLHVSRIARMVNCFVIFQKLVTDNDKNVVRQSCNCYHPRPQVVDGGTASDYRG